MIGSTGQKDRSSNELVLSVAPTVTIAPTAAAVGNVTLTVTTVPQISLTQRASLLFNDAEVLPQARAQATDPFIFDLGAVKAGDYVVRLRVDGVDSIPVDRKSSVLEFDTNQTLKVS